MSSVHAAEGLPLAHLERLTDEHGLFEHAEYDRPRAEHGYCVDDAARALLVLARERRPTRGATRLTDTYLGFLERAIRPGGRAHNRMDADGRFTDEPGTGDWWGRAIRALGTAAVHAPDPAVRRRSFRAYARASQAVSHDLRATAFAAIGASEVLVCARHASAAASRTTPHLASSHRLLAEAAVHIAERPDPSWPWPEPRLRYSNGTLPEALLAVGHATGEPHVTARGLALLAFLLEVEAADGWLSVTGTAGRGPGEASPQFDQQPIEVWAIAQACARAFEVTGQERWLQGLRLAWGWFVGENDAGESMIDPETGAGYDGLTAGGRNGNRGAESTLAAVGTYQVARRLLNVEWPTRAVAAVPAGADA